MILSFMYGNIQYIEFLILAFKKHERDVNKVQKTVVCVTDQLNCERIIKSSNLLSNLSNTTLDVISIVNPSQEQFNPSAIEYLFEVSKKIMQPCLFFIQMILKKQCIILLKIINQ